MCSIAGVKTKEIEEKIDIEDNCVPFSASAQDGSETKRYGTERIPLHAMD